MTAPIDSKSAERLVMTVPEAAELLGISRESAYKAARAGQLPTVTLGRRLLVPVARLNAFLGVDGQRTSV
jgi:excisionase family DNA binding protein